MVTPGGAVALVRRLSSTSTISLGRRSCCSTSIFDKADHDESVEKRNERLDRVWCANLANLNLAYISPAFHFSLGSRDHHNGQNLVWWDMDRAPVTDPNADLHQIKRNIRKSMRSIGYVGPFAIRGYGDFDKMPAAFREQLKPKKISKRNFGRILPENSFLDVPSNGDEFGAAAFVVADMLASLTKYAPPANHLFVTAHDDVFSYSLNMMRSRFCNILLARPTNSDVVNDYLATSIWYWEDLMEGKSAWLMDETDDEEEEADPIFDLESSQLEQESC